MTFPRLERLKYSLLNAQLVVDKINNGEAQTLGKSKMRVIFSKLLKPETLIDQMFYNITAICIAKAKKCLKNIHYLGMRQESYYWKGFQLFEVLLGCIVFTSSKTFLSPFCVRAEHSTYFTALNSFARRSPISRLSGFCLFFAESRRCWYLCLWKTWTASRSKCKALFLKYLVHVQSN